MTTAPIAPPAVAKKRRRLSFAAWLLDLSTLFISIRLSDRCRVVFPVAGLLAEARYATAETEVQAASLRATRRVMKPLAEPRLSPKAWRRPVNENAPQAALRAARSRAAKS